MKGTFWGGWLKGPPPPPPPPRRSDRKSRYFTENLLSVDPVLADCEQNINKSNIFWVYAPPNLCVILKVYLKLKSAESHIGVLWTKNI